MLYTIMPLEAVLSNSKESEKVVLCRVRGLVAECTVNGSTATVRRIISSRPRDYVYNADIIGKVIKYTGK